LEWAKEGEKRGENYPEEVMKWETENDAGGGEMGGAHLKKNRKRGTREKDQPQVN